MFALTLTSFSCASLFLLCSSALQLLQTQGDTAMATLCLQERMEQTRALNLDGVIRIDPSRATNWDSTTLTRTLTSLLNTPPAAAASLPVLMEDITLTPYPTSDRSVHLRRSATGVVTVESKPPDTDLSLVKATIIRVDWRATWTGRTRRHLRENSLLMVRGGYLP